MLILKRGIAVLLSQLIGLSLAVFGQQRDTAPSFAEVALTVRLLPTRIYAARQLYSSSALLQRRNRRQVRATTPPATGGADLLLQRLEIPLPVRLDR